MCETTNKVIYRSKGLALKAAVSFTRQKSWKGNPPTAYLCSFCNGWHLTATKQKK